MMNSDLFYNWIMNNITKILAEENETEDAINIKLNQRSEPSLFISFHQSF